MAEYYPIVKKIVFFSGGAKFSFSTLSQTTTPRMTGKPKGMADCL